MLGYFSCNREAPSVSARLLYCPPIFVENLEPSPLIVNLIKVATLTPQVNTINGVCVSTLDAFCVISHV